MSRDLWNESEVLVDRKSKFQARCHPLLNQTEIPDLLKNLLAQDKHVAKASHPHMYAWRTATVVQAKNDSKARKTSSKKKNNTSIQEDNIISYKDLQQGSFDGGESGAGQRLLTLLERSNIVNVMVIVTRWYGGTPLGSVRFRHISSTAVESLKRGNFLSN